MPKKVTMANTFKAHSRLFLHQELSDDPIDIKYIQFGEIHFGWRFLFLNIIVALFET